MRAGVRNEIEQANKGARMIATSSSYSRKRDADGEERTCLQASMETSFPPDDAAFF